MATRDAYCVSCGPSQADEVGCLTCRCAQCGNPCGAIVLTVIGKQGEQQICSSCWKGVKR